MWPDILLMRSVARAHASFRSSPRCLPSNPLPSVPILPRPTLCPKHSGAYCNCTATGPEPSRTQQENDSARNPEISVSERDFSTHQDEAELTKPPSHCG